MGLVGFWLGFGGLGVERHKWLLAGVLQPLPAGVTTNHSISAAKQVSCGG
jgi:hypothetical protein